MKGNLFFHRAAPPRPGTGRTAAYPSLGDKAFAKCKRTRPERGLHASESNKALTINVMQKIGVHQKMETACDADVAKPFADKVFEQDDAKARGNGGDAAARRARSLGGRRTEAEEGCS